MAKTKKNQRRGNDAAKASRKCYRHADRAEVGLLSRVDNFITNNKRFTAWVTLACLWLALMEFSPFVGWALEEWRDYKKPIIEMAEIDGQPGGIHLDDGVIGNPVLVQFWITNQGLSQAVITGESGDVELGPDAEDKLRPGLWHTENTQINKVPMSLQAFTSGVVTSGDDPKFHSPGSIAAYVRVRYQDSDGHPYESDICFVQGLTPIMDYCHHHFHGIIDCAKDKCDKF